MSHAELIDTLLQSDEPSLRWKARVNVLGDSRQSKEIQALEQDIKFSPRVRSLLQNVDASGRLVVDKGVYAKWQGAHWVLLTLADIGYPYGDPALHPIAGQLLETWLAERFFNEFEAQSKADVYAHQHDALAVMEGRVRTCASQQGNTLYCLLKLGIEDERKHQLVERLLHWQWPDGGWNCDKEAHAHKSTFIHSLWSMRAMALYAQQEDDKAAEESARRAADFFLRRRLFKRETTGKIILDEFIKLHYPLYWHYDVLGALKVFAEIGLTDDPRFGDALDLLESKQLPDGGWPAESRYYKKVTEEIALGNDYVDWGGTSAKKMNPWVTADALYVLKRFGRLDA